MKIEKQLNKSELIIKLSGELNSTTAPDFEKVIKNDLNSVESLIIDCQDLAYMSSAGLRVLLVAQKIMNQQGTMVLRHVNESIKDIFDITGFLNILTIED